MKKHMCMAIFFLNIFASYALAQSDSPAPTSPWGPGVEVQPAPGWPSTPTPPSQPPSTQPPPAQPAPQPEATPEQHITTTHQSENTKKANELIKKGIALLGKKKYQEALDAFKDAETLDATIPQAPFGIGMALLGLNKPSEAVEAFERARKLKPTEANILYYLGLSYEQAGNNAKATESYIEALKLKPDFERCRDALIELYMENEKWDEALNQLNESIKINPSIAKKFILRGDVYYQVGNNDYAKADYAKALLLFPGSEGAIVGIARIDAITGKHQEALKVIEPIIKKFPQDPIPRLVKAIALFHAGKTQEAIAEIESAVKLGEKNYFVLVEAAEYLIEAKQYERAVELLKAASQLKPKSPTPHKLLVSVYDELGRAEDADKEREMLKSLEMSH